MEAGRDKDIELLRVEARQERLEGEVWGRERHTQQDIKDTERQREEARDGRLRGGGRRGRGRGAAAKKHTYKEGKSAH